MLLRGNAIRYDTLVVAVAADHAYFGHILVLIRWTASLVTRGRGARLITGDSHRAAAPAQSPRAPLPLRAA